MPRSALLEPRIAVRILLGGSGWRWAVCSLRGAVVAACTIRGYAPVGARCSMSVGVDIAYFSMMYACTLVMSVGDRPF